MPIQKSRPGTPEKPTSAPKVLPIHRDRPSDAPTLIDRCLAGDAAGWDQLYDDLHPKLLRAVRGIMRQNTQDHNVVEEIVARVWFSLIDRRHQTLKQFDQHRGVKISTYLIVLARYEWLQYCRAERRRVRREQVFASRGQHHVEAVDSTLVYHFKEFREVLTERERQYWDHLFEATPVEGALVFSPANGWKLRERIRKKLQKYVAEFPDG